MAANMQNLPENLLLDILSLVPASDLICNCRLICSQWRDLVDLPVLWKRKFQKRDSDSSPKPLTFYIFSRLKKNLIKNPDGQDGLDSWEIHPVAEGHWQIEEMFTGESKRFRWKIDEHQIVWLGENDGNAPVQVYKCFAARNGSCSKSQLITLKDEGYWDELMDEARPIIFVKDWFSGLLDSPYKLTVKLLSADSEVLEEYPYKTYGVTRWFPVYHAINNYPQGVRHILFEHKWHKEDVVTTCAEMKVSQSSLTLHAPPTRD
ncbi:F-box only protein 44-like isoform X2 [Lacerta agilis]|nr:F-box only protein 44-like isoform X2 [Lacerta agilis]